MHTLARAQEQARDAHPREPRKCKGPHPATRASTSGQKNWPGAKRSFLPAPGHPRSVPPGHGSLLANYQPTVTVAIVGFSVCSDELKPPTSSYAKPYDSALMLWSCQNFEYEFDGDA